MKSIEIPTLVLEGSQFDPLLIKAQQIMLQIQKELRQKQPQDDLTLLANTKEIMRKNNQVSALVTRSLFRHILANNSIKFRN
jgi:hypothetical protein